MGADHKLDLTSDTTHLIVGSTDSLKYQYVAREREDITVLKPEWIKAVQDVWKEDRPLDLDALTLEYRVPTLAGLKICITGFDDLSFRAQLQKNVTDNGGIYTGDLTKDVTHLIAAKPEGKKYEYGIQWQTKVVSLKWYKDTLNRGMQLDESFYHPTVSVAEQGVGAWNRKTRASPQPGKRTREENAGPEPPRKLRRTASARLGSQSQDVWSDIVGAGFEAQDDSRPPLKPSVSMPALRRTNQLAEGPQHIQSDPINNESETARPDGRFLAGYHFLVQCLDQKRNEHLKKILTGLGATLLDEDETQATVEPNKMLVILSHDVAKAGAVSKGVIPDGFQAVSELWLEKCMIAKSFITPQRYPLGQVIREPRRSFEGLSINASGFDVVENVHIVKIVTLLGGTYVEVLSSAVSLLICRNAFRRREKLELAQQLEIPVVTEDWLWTTLNSHSQEDIKDYLLQPLRTRGANIPAPMQNKAPPKEKPLAGTTSAKVQIGQGPAHRQKSELEKPTTSTLGGEHSNRSNTVKVHQSSLEEADGPKLHGSCEHASTSVGSEIQAESHPPGKHPLREVAPTSARRNGKAAEHSKAAPRSLDGASSMEEAERKENIMSVAGHTAKPVDVEAVNGVIQDMLDARSKKKAESGRVADDSKKNRLKGRALSNLSNSSSKSVLRHSRASSIDSINTDGRGSEVPAILSGENQNDSTAAAGRSNFSFTGRAKTTLAGLNSAALGMDDPDIARAGRYQAEEAAPRMTQLGYEDPEEAILLREKLAASRKRRSKKEGAEEKSGSHDEDSKPPLAKQKHSDRKIRDDDILVQADAGWGAGRRTRHKQRSPQDMKEF